MAHLLLKRKFAQPYKCDKLYLHVIILGPIKSRDNQCVTQGSCTDNIIAWVEALDHKKDH